MVCLVGCVVCFWLCVVVFVRVCLFVGVGFVGFDCFVVGFFVCGWVLVV